MNIKFCFKYIIILLSTIIIMPFIIAAFIVSMIALGIYYVAYVVVAPAFAIEWLTGLIANMKNESDANRKKLKNPILKFDDWLFDLSRWKLG